MAKKYLTAKNLKRTTKNGDVIWSPKALDWPLRVPMFLVPLREIRVALLEYLDSLGEEFRRIETSSQIKREVGRVSKRLCETLVALKKVENEDIPF